jgi:hypothetical protein
MAEPKKEPVDKSFPASLRRIANEWIAMPTFANIDAARALLNEADLLDPDTEVKKSKKGLQQEVETAEAKVAKAKAILADPNASREEHAEAAKTLKSA